jgi:hypothetical protein
MCIIKNRIYNFYFKKKRTNQAPVVHTCNLSYSGSRDQEDCGSKPAPANSLRDRISKNPSQKWPITGGMAQGVGPKFKFSTAKMNKEK